MNIQSTLVAVAAVPIGAALVGPSGMFYSPSEYSALSVMIFVSAVAASLIAWGVSGARTRHPVLSAVACALYAPIAFSVLWKIICHGIPGLFIGCALFTAFSMLLCWLKGRRINHES
jgi:hypothetical protein